MPRSQRPVTDSETPVPLRPVTDSETPVLLLRWIPGLPRSQRPCHRHRSCYFGGFLACRGPNAHVTDSVARCSADHPLPQTEERRSRDTGRSQHAVTDSEAPGPQLKWIPGVPQSQRQCHGPRGTGSATLVDLGTLRFWPPLPQTGDTGGSDTGGSQQAVTDSEAPGRYFGGSLACRGPNAQSRTQRHRSRYFGRSLACRGPNAMSRAQRHRSRDFGGSGHAAVLTTPCHRPGSAGPRDTGGSQQPSRTRRHRAATPMSRTQRHWSRHFGGSWHAAVLATLATDRGAPVPRHAACRHGPGGTGPLLWRPNRPCHVLGGTSPASLTCRTHSPRLAPARGHAHGTPRGRSARIRSGCRADAAKSVVGVAGPRDLPKLRDSCPRPHRPR